MVHPLYHAATLILHETLGKTATFRDGQWEAIEALVIRRERVLVVQRTGWGKSLVYFIATRLLRQSGGGVTLLISPLLALMRNQIEQAERYGLKAVTINSANYQSHDEIEALLIRQEADILFISPERLSSERFQQKVWQTLQPHIGMLVVDEAHCISDWGHDFRPNYRRIMGLLDQLPPATPILGTTATANDRVIQDVRDVLGQTVSVWRGKLTRESLRLFVFNEPLDAAYRLLLLTKILKEPYMTGSGIIYCLTKRDCVRVAEWLNAEGIDAKPYYADVENDQGLDRVKLEQDLSANRIKALVASVALGMGYDKPDLKFVIHYQAPGSVISYYQQIGRAGRGIDNAFIILMSGIEDQRIHEYFIGEAFPKQYHVSEVVDALLDLPLNLNQLQKFVNVQQKTLKRILAHLEAIGMIAKVDRKYEVIDPTIHLDYVRWEQISAQRHKELDQINKYIHHQGCLMRYLADALEDQEGAQVACGKCKNCRQTQYNYVPSQPDLDRAYHFLREGKHIMIEPRKMYPPRFSKKRGLRGKFKFPPNAAGIALCYYHELGWGDLVQKGKYQDNHFADELVMESAKRLGRWFQSLAEPPQWVTAVPSLRRPRLVHDFADRVAQALGLPFHAIIHKSENRPEQKTMQNSHQQVHNLIGAFHIEGHVMASPVLLIDDMVDSRWTMTIIGQALQEAGSGLVYPFALAKVGAGDS